MGVLKKSLRTLKRAMAILAAIALGMGLLVGSYFVLIEINVWVWSLF